MAYSTGAEERGRIFAGEAGLRGLRRQLERELGFEVDLSIIQRGGLFDDGPWMDLGRQHELRLL